MHTPRMNYRQSMSLNEAVMEAMTGRMSDSKIKADLEKMSDKELKDTIKLLKAMKDNQEMIAKAAIETAEEEGLMDMEEEAGAMGGRGGAAPPAGGAARSGGFFGGGSKPTGTRPGKGPDISKKQKKKRKNNEILEYALLGTLPVIGMVIRKLSNGPSTSIMITAGETNIKNL